MTSKPIENTLPPILKTTALEFTKEFLQSLHWLNETTQNIFITGKAGTGKSTLLNYFRKQTPKKTAVLAPTGVAAINVQGETVHSFFKFKPSITLDEAKRLGKKFKNNPLYRKLETLVIDEISMVRADLLDCVDLFLKEARKNQQPFGGIQMVFIGDLYQLPPVVVENEKTALNMRYQSPYFFHAKVMEALLSDADSSGIQFVELQKIYRQQDQEFIHLLNSIRNKSIDDDQLETLNQRVIQPGESLPGNYIYLTSTNRQADLVNMMNLEKLPSPLHRFTGDKVGEFPEKYLPTDIQLSVKENARVMLLNNDPGGRWVNGTLGIVKKVYKEQIAVRIDAGDTVTVEPYTWNLYQSHFNEQSQSIEHEEIGSFTQFPVRLAWAITIHKSQGKTFDKIVVDIGTGTFAHGQLYVALSRCRTFEGLALKSPLRKKDIWMDYRVVHFLTALQTKLSREQLQ